MAYGIFEKPKAQHSPFCGTAKIWPWIDVEECEECARRRESVMTALRARFGIKDPSHD